MPLFQKAVFHTTVARLGDLPVDSCGEVAFAGRSNAGKSSAINTLANHTRLAYVSKTPGRTQHLNFFSLSEGRYLVDLPGYGFAKAPGDIRSQWDALLAPYLRFREPLRGLVLIVDCRSLLTELDEQMLAWFAQTGKPVHVLMTKVDKLTRAEQMRALQAMRESVRALGDEDFAQRCSVQLFSSLKKIGVDAAKKVLGAWMGLDVQATPAPPAAPRTEKKARPRNRTAKGWSARAAASALPSARQERRAELARQAQSTPESLVSVAADATNETNVANVTNKANDAKPPIAADSNTDASEK
ncbi:YihA family ribosome biogenesis GTP-binding protein [Rhodocyclus tenuis]|uniref:Probable GTP-binding protein EngB n=1 Tax=Rhodocyclus gracilis TaxID=2929842 RepID=A0ABX0WHQ1_9RHOO|nr:ribosome biogenesis GTP-binding protein YihA/YsxC [Rhodocyclus gracilis]MRD72673.1 YihA family ribosome biogenesis GTP-binding protein [Rhodocyclus gracilis]NJA88200.1 YihA family ribosome biogenesis GTP-binding protein [Rhodocyclus gracilis]